MKCETLRRSPSRKAGAPSGPETACRRWSTALAVAPRNLFDDDRATAGAIDAPHRVEKKDQKAPERNELEAPFGELIITGRWPVATRTDCRGLLRGRTVISMLLSSELKRAC